MGMSTSASIHRIEAAMAKIATALPDNPALGPVWGRLQVMWTEAKAGQAQETEAQASARAWLAQKEMSAINAAMSSSGSPAP